MGLLEFSFLFFLCAVMLKVIVLSYEIDKVVDEEARQRKIEQVYLNRKRMYERGK